MRDGFEGRDTAGEVMTGCTLRRFADGLALGCGFSGTGTAITMVNVNAMAATGGDSIYSSKRGADDGVDTHQTNSIIAIIHIQFGRCKHEFRVRKLGSERPGSGLGIQQILWMKDMRYATHTHIYTTNR